MVTMTICRLDGVGPLGATIAMSMRSREHRVVTSTHIVGLTPWAVALTDVAAIVVFGMVIRHMRHQRNRRSS